MITRISIPIRQIGHVITEIGIVIMRVIEDILTRLGEEGDTAYLLWQ